jgi:hypothetical protein
MTFRQQEEVTVSLPARQDEQFIKDLVISAFTLKVWTNLQYFYRLIYKYAITFIDDKCIMDDRRTM